MNGRVVNSGGVDEFYSDPLGDAKNNAIKNILNIVDLAFDPEDRFSRRREKVRKVVMDSINDLYRAFVLEIENAKKLG
jgi:hypothetical protein